MKKKERYDYKSILIEVRKIKKQYCQKCIYFEDFECKKNKVYKQCLSKNERLKKDE